ncbi:MAG: hypothetical protein AAF772_21150 [Acidobacteriota bacterium]
MRALDDALRARAEDAGLDGLTLEAAADGIDRAPDDVRTRLDDATRSGRLLRLDARDGPVWLAPRAVQRLIADAPRDPQMRDGWLRARLGPTTYDALGDAYAMLVARAAPAAGAKPARADGPLARAIVAAMADDGLTPRSPPALARALGAKPRIVEGVQRALVKGGALVRLPETEPPLLTTAQAVDDLVESLGATGWTTVSIADIKHRFGLRRRLALP